MFALTIEDMDTWTNLADLITNRVSIANQLLGAKYDGCLENPLRVLCKRGRYVCKLCGSDYATWRIYDMASTQYAYERISALSDGLWLIGRGGLISK